MQSFFDTDIGRIAYHLEHSARRHLIIRIEDNGEVNVRAPARFPLSQIEYFLKKKSKWIIRKSDEQKRKFSRYADKTFADGQEFLFLGKKHPLRIVPGQKRTVRIDFDGHSWLVETPAQTVVMEPNIKKKLVDWYREQAEELLAPRVFHYSRIIGLAPETIKIRSQKRLWGSCDKNKKAIHLNWQLIMSPISVIDYVIVHELCHLRVANHSKRFWREVAKVIPDYKIKHQWLKENSWDMQLPEREQ